MPPKLVKPADDAETEDVSDSPINHNFQAAHMPELLKLNEFLDHPRYIRPSGDREINIVNRLKGICYHIPDHDIVKFFKRMDACHQNKRLTLCISELQKEYSGIMLDFDILQDTETTQLNDENIQLICYVIVEELMRILKFRDDTKRELIHVGVIRKPHVKPVEDPSGSVLYFKDGMHILIPSVQVLRPVKKYLIECLLKSDALEKALNDINPTCKRVKNEPYSRANFLDQMSASVPVFLVNCASKPNTPPYRLVNFYEVTLYLDMKRITFKPLPLLESYTAYEFSLNYERPEGKIKKKHFDISERFMTEVSQYSKNTQAEEEKIRNFGTLSLHSIHDRQRAEIKDLLDTLAPIRSRTYETWFAVVCVLANLSPSYKDLALYFSANSSKLPQFETYWAQALRGPRSGKKAMGIGTLHYWAKQDNPDRFDQLRNTTMSSFLNGLIFSPLCDGELGHSDIADILFKLLPYKYVTDYPEGERVRKWYEFVLEADDQQDGEIFKWRQCREAPTSLNYYISHTLFDTCGSFVQAINLQLADAVGPHAGYLKKILTNFKRTLKNLKNTNFKTNILKEAELCFSRVGFAATLDKDPLVRGVANGIIKLSNIPGVRPIFINSHHTYPISKFTPIPYIAFNPYDEKTKLLLITLRSTIPDSEPDTFEWLMSYFATTIDGLPKACMFVMAVGAGANGKTAIVELIKSVIGQYGVKMQLSYLTSRTTNAENATPAQMMLQYASLAYYSEAEKYEKLNAARIKEVTGQETLAGRRLRQETINFKPRCHHFITSNYGFDINDSSHGLWRRLVYIRLKITFVKPDETIYDPANPYQRLANTDITDKWTEDNEIRGRYLGFLVYTHYWLYRRYEGKLSNIYNPHIKFDTAKYRLSQDSISEFTSKRLVKCVDATTEYNLMDEIKKYIKWYELYKSEKIPAVGLSEEFQNSIIGKHIQSKARCVVLVGHRFLDEHEKPGIGEEYAQRDICAIEPPANNWGLPSETPEQYYQRVCREYDAVKHLFPAEGQADIDLDTVDVKPINEAKILDLNMPDLRTPDLRAPDLKTHIKGPTVEIQGKIMPSGIVLKHLDEDHVEARENQETQIKKINMYNISLNLPYEIAEV
jgi:hypothetical protein